MWALLLDKDSNLLMKIISTLANYTMFYIKIQRSTKGSATRFLIELSPFQIGYNLLKMINFYMSTMNKIALSFMPLSPQSLSLSICKALCRRDH